MINPARNLEHAISIISEFHHWSLQVENRKGMRTYSCTLWEGGGRVIAHRKTPLLAIEAARVKLDKRLTPQLRIVG